MKKKKTLLQIIMIPILSMVLGLGILPYILLILSGIRSTMEQNIIRMDNHMVENRKVILENEMLEHWRGIYKESDRLSDSLARELELRAISIDQFLGTKDAQREYLETIFPSMVDSLQYNTASGLFMILANNEPTDTAADYQGFYLRDSDPQTRITTNADLLLEKGSKELSQGLSISLDSAWSTNFHFMGQGVRNADDFFYVPYLAAIKNRTIEMENFGYWSTPFVLEDHYMDSQSIITYSVPLIYKDTIYGILGVEVNVNYLMDYFTVKDFDSNLNAGYALVIQHGENEYEKIVGKGSLYNAITGKDNIFSLKKIPKSDIYVVERESVGKQGIYCTFSPLRLYSNNVPYDNTDWLLCGFVTEESIYGLGKTVYHKMLLAMLCSLLFATIMVYILIRYVTKPVYRLVESVRNGVEGIHHFVNSNIIEIDELHEVVENLTDAQKQNEDQLLEEKERYRIAVENSQDVFFIFRVKEQMLQIVNSRDEDGIWDCKAHPEYLYNDAIYAKDRDRVFSIVKSKEKEINLEFKLRDMHRQDYEWVNLSASLIRDEEGNLKRIVGCIRNIHKRKLLEEAQTKKHYYDSLTTFYRLEYGLKAIEEYGTARENSILLAIDIDRFATIDEQYGLVMGDVLVQQLAKILSDSCDERNLSDAVFIRAGADQILFWCPNIKREEAINLAEDVYEQFASLVKEKYYTITFRCGITETGKKFDEERCIGQVMTALVIAKNKKKKIVCWQELTEEEKESAEKSAFTEIDPINHLKKLSLPYLAMNLLDRGNNINVILDILACKLRESYQFENMVITSFRREELASSCTYLFKETDVLSVSNAVLHCTETDYQQFVQETKMQQILQINGEEWYQSVLGEFGKKKAVGYHMRDNAQYSGSILFLGIPEEIFEDENQRKQLEEIAVIIQNKINLERHDLSAKAKSEFLARMSHEIRTPMNGIIGMTEIALRPEQSEERRLDCLKKIASSSNYLLGLLNDVLDMSKIESGKMKLVIEKCNLCKLIDGLQPLMESKFREKDIHYEQEIDMKHTSFLCDGLRINQILVNFLGNAVKYSNYGGNVTLVVRERVVTEDGSEIYFAVKDDGVGIEEEKQQFIFKRFEQADDSESARRQGTGLGLAISSSLVHMMDSDIQLESEPDKGSTFSFTITLQPVEEDTVTGKTQTAEFDLTGKHVLAVEDNALNMEIVRTVLEEYGMVVEEAHDGQEAVTIMENAKAGQYDVILMDIMMPVMDGLEATRRIRRIDREDCRTMPIIAMSANAFDEDVKRSLESGMTTHLSKPLNMEKLKSTLAKYLRK